MDVAPSTFHAAPWHVVVPVKGRAGAKTRLVPPPGVDRGDLALAMAADALAVVRRVVGNDHLLVVTADPEVAAAVRADGSRAVADPGRGLVAAVEAGLSAVASRPFRAVLLGDLPSLRDADLAAALAEGGVRSRAFVADRQDTGTTLLMATGEAAHVVRFGTGSAAAHAAAGYERLALDVPTLRTDVDDADDLAAATALGLGPSTALLLDDAVADSA